MTCNFCNSVNFNYPLSSKNSTYIYCKQSNTKLDIYHKNITIDFMLKNLVKTLKHLKTNYLKIEVKRDYNTIELIINNITIFIADFKYEFSKKDIYYMENIIYELVQDFNKFHLSKVDIVVCN